MLPRWKTQFFIKFFEGGIIMQEGNRGQPKEDPFHVFVPLLPLNMAQNDISDSPIPSWNVPGPWNYPETAVSRQLLLTTALWNYAKSAPKFLNMGLTPPPLLNDVQKNCGVGFGWHPLASQIIELIKISLPQIQESSMSEMLIWPLDFPVLFQSSARLCIKSQIRLGALEPSNYCGDQPDLVIITIHKICRM